MYAKFTSEAEAAAGASYNFYIKVDVLLKSKSFYN